MKGGRKKEKKNNKRKKEHQNMKEMIREKFSEIEGRKFLGTPGVLYTGSKPSLCEGFKYDVKDRKIWC